MQRRTRAGRLPRERRGISSIVGALFFVLIVLVALTGFATVFNSYSGYQKAVSSADAAKTQAAETSLSLLGPQFGSPGAPVSAAPGGSGVQGPTGYTSETKLVYGSGLWWTFFTDGTNIDCRTSADGLAWGSSTAVVYPTGSPTLSHSANLAACSATSCSAGFGGGAVAAGDVLALTVGSVANPPTSVTDTMANSFSAGVSSSVALPNTPAVMNAANEAACTGTSCGDGFGPASVSSGDVLALTVASVTNTPSSVTDTLGNGFSLGVSNSVAVPSVPNLAHNGKEKACTATSCGQGFGPGGVGAVGDVLAFTVAWIDSAAPTISDSFGNTFALAASNSVTTGGHTYYSYIYDATSISSGGGETITATFGVSTSSWVSAYDVSGATTASPQTSTGSSTTAVAASFVTSFTPIANSFVIGGVVTGGSTTLTGGTGYTVPGGGAGNNCGHMQGCSEYESGDGSTSTTAPMSFSSNQAFAEAAVALAPLYTTYYSWIYYATSSSSGTDTITANFASSTSAWVSAYDVSGITTAGALTSTGSSSTAVGSGSVGTLNPSTNAFVLAGLATSNAEKPAPGTGYTQPGGTGPGDPCNNQQGCSEYLIDTTGASTNAPWTFSVNVGYAEAAMAFAPTTTPYYSYIYYATSSSSGTDTITANFASTTSATVSAYDVSGIATTIILTSTGSSVPTTTTPSVAAFTPPTNSFVIAGIETGTVVGFTAGTGFSIPGGAAPCNNQLGCSEYETGSGSSTTAPWTLNSQESFAETAIAFGLAGYSKGYAFSVALSGPTLYVAVAQTPGTTTNAFYWRYGTISSGGCASISWATSLTTVTSTNSAVGPVSTETDSLGNTWVALTTQSGSNYLVEVWEHASGAGAGTWTQQDSISFGSTLPAEAIDPWACSGTGCAVLVYGPALVTGATSIISTSCTPNCATWTGAVSSPGTSNYAMASSSSLVIGGALYFAGLDATTSGQNVGALNFWAFQIGSLSWPTETTVESAHSAWQAALGSSATTLVLFEAASGGSTLYARSSLTYGNIWFPAVGSPAFTVSSSETSVTGITAAYSGTFAAMWTAGSSSPYSVRFFALSMLPVVANSPFAVQAASLYVKQPSSNSVVQHYDTDGTTSGAAGPFAAWIGAGSEMDLPLVPNPGGSLLLWSTSTAYLFTLTTATGVVDAEAVTSPP
jgi:hypothetical protein